ncbi:type II secretion system minor pseudopilin GspK [Desulfogranum japonicum]|uniref:type II secretion system minor pseudopilin GspK n=1 Tax=Desulfogranum japonicum TaxID=231447 RepID=UPI00042448E8|nr:type II secretion system minor pseudopilin GspK [Desulfogranum japonicum]
MRSLQNDQRGVAMLLALLTMSFMVVLTVQLITDVNQQVHESRSAIHSVQNQEALMSALALVQTALFADKQENRGDSYLDQWAHINQETLRTLFGGTELQIRVADLTGLLQVNALVQKKQVGTKQNTKDLAKIMEKQRELWLRFLLSGNFVIEDEEDARTVVDSLCDWLDKDDEPRENGAESSFYGSLSPGYSAGNHSIIHLSELALIKGMSNELLYGDEEHDGILKYLTATGTNGKININTAPQPVLMALADGITDDMVEAMITFREEKENHEALDSIDWYKQVDEFPGDITLDQDLIGIQSTYFSVDIVSREVTVVQRGSALLERDDKGAQSLLQWHVE